MNTGFKTNARLRWLTRDESGGTIAELAIIVPFLAVMIAGVTEFGRLFQTYTTLAKATRCSARHLSNHKAPYSNAVLTEATNLAVCGKLTCAGGDELVKGMTAAKVCIEDQPVTATVRVSIPRVAQNCTNGNDKVPHIYQPIFDIGTLIDSDTFTLELPISPSTTMYYIENVEPEP
ncbi:MAG TPA: TadE family protein [Pyrinomonadaceae bacterium]|nr:TadE family protein [Pyrinomonadaceae bacterium]